MLSVHVHAHNENPVPIKCADAPDRRRAAAVPAATLGAMDQQSPQQPSEPGWGYPPGYVPPPPPPPTQARPGSVTASAAILIALGVLVSLFGLLSLFAGAVFPSVADSPEFRQQFGDLSGALGGLLLALGVIVLAYGVLELLTGIFLLSGRGWARISGLVVAVLGIMFSLLGILPGEGGAGASIVFVILLAAYGYVAWVLASTGSWFRT